MMLRLRGARGSVVGPHALVRLSGIAATLFVGVMALAGCRGGSPDGDPRHVSWDLRLMLSHEERAYLESVPVLRVGLDPRWAPMSFVDNAGHPDGISADYLDFVRQTLGVRFHVVPTRSWAETIQLANGGGLDLVIAASHADGLTEGFQYSTPYVRYPLVIVTRETAPFIGGAEDIVGSEIAIVKDSEAFRMQLPNLLGAHTMVVSSADEGLETVANGRAFAYIGNLGVIDRLVREKYPGILRVAAPAGHIEDLSFALAPRYARLLPLVNRVLAAIPESEREHIQNSWLSTRFVFGVPARTLWIVLTPVAVLTGVFLTVLCIYMLRLRKEVRQRRWTEQQLVELTQSLPPVVFQLRFSQGRHPRFALIFVNRRARDWLGLQQPRTEEIFDRFVQSLDDYALFRLTRLFLRSARTFDTVRTELALTLGGPRRAWVNLEAAPQAGEGGQVVWSGFVQDITEAKEVQTALVAAKQGAEAASQARDVFLATVSHEIRTPMSGVVGILQLLDHGRLSVDDQHLLDMARNAAEILLRVLNDILDFAKSENGELTLECAPMSVGEIAERTAGIIAPELERKGLHFDIDVSRALAPSYMGDGQRLGQVLLNLLGNAAKFTDYGAVSLLVSVKSHCGDDDTVSIRVADTGIGISSQDQARLFSPFSQARTNQPGRYGGTGLGLAICKRLIESMGGSIALESEPGRGTTVTLELPLPIERGAGARRNVEAAAQGSADMDIPVLRGAPGRLMLVEDQEINREVLRRQLASLRIVECDVAANGAQAIRQFERFDYAMIITDCAMPVLDGVALIRHIRARERGGERRTALVALTANAMPQQREECFRAGADAVFVKPVSLEQLRDLLDRYGINAPPISELEKAGIPLERHTDLWEKLRRTLEAELATLLSLSLEDDATRAREIAHRILGAASWFHLDEVARAATKLEQCFERGEAPHAPLFDLKAAIARATAETIEGPATRAP